MYLPSKLCSNVHRFTFDCFAAGDPDSANKVAEKLEELTVKDKASDDKKEVQKVTEKKEDEKKENTAEEN